MSKAIAFIFLLAMAAHMIKPFGLPGLRERGDFWKIAVFALLAMLLTVAIRPS